MDTRRRTYAILVGIILLTVPCYLSGIVLLSRAPNRGGSPTLEANTATPTASPTPTRGGTQLPPAIISLTPPGSPTPQATITSSITPTPTDTSTPTDTPTLTPTPTDTSTATPTPTETPTITPTPTPAATDNGMTATPDAVGTP
ncbi:MAG TPA: hypothetical protein PLR07_08975 [Promineifilum sp.]|nr:hypothetical protein [Promineifilum sp.]